MCDKIWFFARFALSLAPITDDHVAFKRHLSMRSVAIMSFSLFSLLPDGQLPRSESESGSSLLDEYLVKLRT